MEGEDEGAGDNPAAGSTSPAEKLLEKGSDELWVLRPLPDSRTVLSAALGVALHTYVTQQWSMGISLPSHGFC